MRKCHIFFRCSNYTVNAKNTFEIVCSYYLKFYFSCECTFGWTGQNCSEEINECDSDPCMNGALCHESSIPGQFVCLCPPFYTGKFCHQHYNPCDPPNDPCQNNSTCLTLVDGNYHCLCRQGKSLYLFQCFILFCFVSLGW